MTADDVDALMQQLPAPSPSPELRERVLRDVGLRFRRPRRVRQVGWGLALATALAGFAAVLGVILPDRSSPGGRGEPRVDLKFARIEWQFQTTGAVVRWTVSDHQVFLEMRDGAVTAVDRFTGKLEWTLRIPGGTGPDWPPVVAQGVPEEIRQLEADLRKLTEDIDRTLKDKGAGPESQALQRRRATIREMLRVCERGDNVYLLSGKVLSCVSRTNGTLKWTNLLAFPPSGPPFAIRNFVFVPDAAASRVHVLDVEKNGAEVTAYAPAVPARPNPTLGGPVYADPSVFFVAPDGTLHCYRVTDGKLVWIHQAGAGAIGGPTVHVLRSQGIIIRLVFFSVGPTLYAMDADAGEVVWKYQAGPSFQGTPILMGDTVYAGTEKGDLLALEALPAGVGWKARPARLRWQLGGCDRFLLKTPTRAYVLGANREILAVDESTGGVAERYSTGLFTEFAARFSDGRLYAVRPGEVVCFVERP